MIYKVVAYRQSDDELLPSDPGRVLFLYISKLRHVSRIW